MRRMTMILALLLVLPMLAACGIQKGDVSQMEIVPAASSFFTEREISDAEDALMDAFQTEFPEYTLVKLWYPGDLDTLEESDTDGRAIVLYTDIHTIP